MPSALPFALAAALLGLLLGSFLNVCISRLPAGESITHPRSHCRCCGRTLRWLENVPLLSWLLQRGKCRGCGATIPWRYPAVELITSAWFLLTCVVTFHALEAASAPGAPDHTARIVIGGLSTALLGFFLIGLAVIDWQTHTLPDLLTFPGAAVGFFLACSQAAFLQTGEADIHFSPRSKMRLQSPGSFAARGDVFLTGPESLVLGRIAAILAAVGLLLLIRAVYQALRGRQGLGLGDAKLLGMIAAFLGFGNAFLTLFLGMVTCACYAMYLLLRGRATAASKLPLGTFLCGAGLVNALIGEVLLTWYKGLL